MNPFYLVKITDNKWAGKFLDGEVYMQPLSAFGDLLRRNESSSNDFRGDIVEGASESFSDQQQSSFFNDILPSNSQEFCGFGQIAEYILQERVFCLYCLEYSKTNGFLNPDKRIEQFGDTAVIILEPLIFLQRLFYKFLSLYDNEFWAGAKRVAYDIDLTKASTYDEFTKRNSYSWQNEFRIALDVSKGLADKQAWEDMSDFCRIMFLNQGGEVDHDAERGPILIDIGDIRDLCTTVSTIDFINLRIPSDKMKNAENIRPIEPPRSPFVTSYRPILIS
jgi:hypothetical protein